MHVLHISTTDSGGAGLCCIRIHLALLKMGIESKVVVMEKTTDIPYVYKYDSLKYLLYRAFSKVLLKIGVLFTDYNKIKYLAHKYNTAYTRPVSFVDLTRCDLMEWADVIHLHWVANYLDLPSFMCKINKPIVWTLHDENLFYGIAHHHKSVLPKNRYEIKYRNIKKNAVLNSRNLNIVFLSKMMFDRFGNEEIIKGRYKTIINNSVDGHMFFPHNRSKMRQQYNIAEDYKVFLFIANNIDDPNKGLDILSKALQELNMDRVMILAIGNNPHKKKWPLTCTLGKVVKVEKLCELISLCDYFVMPSYQEAFPQSPLEAMACGLPVLSFPVSGTSEMIDSKNGIICRDFTIGSLKDAIIEMMSKEYDSNYIRKSVLKKFSPNIICAKYIELYNRVLD